MVRSKRCSTKRPDTLMQLSRSSLSEIRLAARCRAIHYYGTKRNIDYEWPLHRRISELTSASAGAPPSERWHCFRTPRSLRLLDRSCFYQERSHEAVAAMAKRSRG